jgi:hypothetical protein
MDFYPFFRIKKLFCWLEERRGDSAISAIASLIDQTAQ